MKNAPVGRRIGAAAVDFLLFFAIHFVTMVLVIAGLEVTNLAALVVLYAALLFLYGAPEVFGAGTVGKRLLRLRIRDAAGTEASGGRLALRWILKQLRSWASLGSRSPSLSRTGLRPAPLSRSSLEPC